MKRRKIPEMKRPKTSVANGIKNRNNVILTGNYRKLQKGERQRESEEEEDQTYNS